MEQNKEQFVPGEWYASWPKQNEDFGGQTYFSIQTKTPITRDSTYLMPGFYYPHSVQTIEEMKANARLIASAPSLYSALKDLVNDYKEDSTTTFIDKKLHVNVAIKLLKKVLDPENDNY